MTREMITCPELSWTSTQLGSTLDTMAASALLASGTGAGSNTPPAALLDAADATGSAPLAAGTAYPAAGTADSSCHQVVHAHQARDRMTAAESTPVAVRQAAEDPTNRRLRLPNPVGAFLT